jgi:hypothetical protein
LPLSCSRGLERVPDTLSGHPIDTPVSRNVKSPYRACAKTYVGYLKSISYDDPSVRKLLIPRSGFEFSHRLYRG